MSGGIFGYGPVQKHQSQKLKLFETRVIPGASPAKKDRGLNEPAALLRVHVVISSMLLHKLMMRARLRN